nr:hypothetical protein [uncultured Allomuricauda sp.]
MNPLKELENEILELFQEKGSDAKKELQKFLSPSASLKKRAAIRNILSRLEVMNDGTYFLK